MNVAAPNDFAQRIAAENGGMNILRYKEKAKQRFIRLLAGTAANSSAPTETIIGNIAVMIAISKLGFGRRRQH